MSKSNREVETNTGSSNPSYLIDDLASVVAALERRLKFAEEERDRYRDALRDVDREAARLGYGEIRRLALAALCHEIDNKPKPDGGKTYA